MIKKEDIENFIKEIPAIPAIIKKCEQALLEGNLSKAANFASDDFVLTGYFRSIINKPIFGFQKNIQDISQIFSMLGIERSIGILNGYYAMLMSPKKWLVFRMDTNKFTNLQANLVFDWKRFLEEISIKDKEVFKAVTLIPISICICEKIFAKNADILGLIIRSSGASYNEILKREAGFDIFGLCCEIAAKWELDQSIIDIYIDISNKNTHNKIAEYLKLLAAYQFSKPEFANLGLGELFEFDINATEEELEIFMKAVGYEA